VYDARTLEAVVDRSLGSRWLQTVLLGAFASIALLLASTGVYGVIAYAVGQRSREFGIRLALGATRREIVALVMRRGTALFAAGAMVGVLAAAATARVLATLLFDVTSSDPISFGSATIVLFLVALAACGIPARRAARRSVDRSPNRVGADPRVRPSLSRAGPACPPLDLRVAPGPTHGSAPTSR
jgi:putative ABC transport system permease protein